jgi:hypothetical protein
MRWKSTPCHVGGTLSVCESLTNNRTDGETFLRNGYNRPADQRPATDGPKETTLRKPHDLCKLIWWEFIGLFRLKVAPVAENLALRHVLR